MKRFSLRHHAACVLAAAGLLFSSAPPLRAAEGVEGLINLLPEGACIILGIKDTPELVKDWDASGFGRFMEDEAVKKWMAPLYKDGKSAWDRSILKQSGVTLREGLEMYGGATVVALVVEDLEDFTLEEPYIVEISEVKGREAQIQTIKEKQLEAYKKDEYPDAVVKTEEVNGVKVNVFADGDGDDAEWIDGWVIVDGILVDATDRALMEKLLARFGAQNPNPSAARVARLAEIRGGIPDVTLYADLQGLIAKLEAKLNEQAASNPGTPVTPKQILEALGAYELHGLAACMDLVEQQSRGDVVLLHAEKPQGIIPALMRAPSGGAVQQPAFIPQGVDAASATRVNFLGVYDSLMKAISKLGPVAAMVTTQISGIEQQAGVSIRNDLLGSLDDLYVDVTTLALVPGALAPEQNQVAGIKLKNKARFQSAFEALWNLAGQGFGMFDESEFEGYKIRMMKSSLSGGQQIDGTQAPRFGYVITDDYAFLVQGSTDLVHKVLARMKGSASGPSFWDEAKVQQALAALPGGFTGMGASNGSSLLRVMLGTLANAQSMVPGGFTATRNAAPKGPKARPGADDDDTGGGEGGGWFNPKATPPNEVFDRYFGMGATGVYSHPDATQVIYISQPPANP